MEACYERNNHTLYHRLHIKPSYIAYSIYRICFTWRVHGQVREVSNKTRTSTPIESGLNRHIMESRKLIGAQLLKIKSSYLRKLRAVFNQRELFLFTLK